MVRSGYSSIPSEALTLTSNLDHPGLKNSDAHERPATTLLSAMFALPVLVMEGAIGRP